VYGVFRVPIRRLAALILFAALVGACLFAWAISALFRAVIQVQTHLVAASEARAGESISLEKLRLGIEQLELFTPAWLLWPFQWLVVRDVIGVVGALAFVSLLAMYAIWWERKTAGHIQSRLGPMRVGGWHGWAQSLADGIKCIAKEDTIPDQADRPLFRLAPYLCFVPVVIAFLALPFGVYWVFRELDVALLVILAMLSIDVVGVLIGGWASNNKWSVYGAMREACQVVSYEIPMGMALLVPIMVAGSLSLSKLADYQQGGWFNWLAWHSPWTFAAMFVYFIASVASCKRAPFDLPEAESELVAGFHTEYSGFRWAVFFFAEYAAMFVVSGLLVILFLGAWDAPWVGLAPAGWKDGALWQQFVYGVAFSGPLWFVFKCLFFIYLQMWMRWTLPRLRIDQVLYSCVQVMLPLAMVALLCSVFWELWLPSSTAAFWVTKVISVVLALIGAIGAIAVLYVAYAGFSRGRALVGSQAVRKPLAGG
jgi:NADH-quinone oxidoreductase subunit H